MQLSGRREALEAAKKNLHSSGGSHKAAGYYRHRRENISAFLDKGGHRLLDVGCGAGQFGAYLKQHGYAAEVVGIEKDPKAAEEATAHLDQVFRVDLNGTTISELLAPAGIETGSFDVVVCADVLEHLVDPWQTLSGLSEYLAPGGKVIASIPNVRHWSVWLPLLLKGRWDYTDAGIMDRTHLRFFTRATMRELFVMAGLDVVEDRPLIGGKWRLLDTCSMHLLRELVAVQWVFVAKRKPGTAT